MPGLMDIGGGFKIIDPQAVAPAAGGGGAASSLSLVNMLNQIKQAPLQTKKLEIETALKANDLMNLEVENLLKRAQLTNALGDERRKEAKFQTEGIKTILDLYKVNPSVGAAMVQRVFPDASTTVNEDGTATISWPTTRVARENGVDQEVPSTDAVQIVLDNRILTPEKRQQLEGQWADRFTGNDAVKAFGEQSRFFRILKESAQLGTGAGDLAIVNAFAKMLDPGGRVTADDVRNAMTTVGLGATVANKIAKAWEDGGPIFGDETPGVARQNFVNAAELFFQNIRKDVMEVGRDLADLAKREGLDPRNIITPVGDITEEQFLTTDESLLNDVKNQLRNRK